VLARVIIQFYYSQIGTVTLYGEMVTCESLMSTDTAGDGGEQPVDWAAVGDRRRAATIHTCL